MMKLNWCTAVVSLALVACGQEARDPLASATALMDKGEDKAAIIELKNALQNRPDLAEARLMLGLALLKAGAAVDAAIELTKARELKLPDARVVPALARAQLLQGKFQIVTDDLGKLALDDVQAAADLSTSVATAYAIQGKYDAASLALDRALSANPQSAQGNILRARLLASQGKLDDAIVVLDQVLARDPALVEAWGTRGDLLLRGKRDQAAALVSFTKALAIKPNDLGSHRAIVAIHLGRRDLTAMEAQVAVMKKVLPNHPETQLAMAQVAFVKQDYKAASDLLVTLLRLAPDDPILLNFAGAVELQLNALQLAESHLGKAIQLLPSAPPPRRVLAQVYMRSGKYERALATLAPLIDADSRDAEALVLAAEAQVLIGRAGVAEGLYQRAARITPEDAKVRTALALTQMVHGRAQSGLDELQAIAKTDASAVADLALISTRIRRKEFPAAVTAIDHLQSKLPDQPTAFALRGRVAMLMKDPVTARKSFERVLEIEPLYFPAVAELAALDRLDKHPELAKQRLEAFIKRDPKNAQARLLMVDTRRSEGADAPEVLRLLDETVRMAPADIPARLRLVEARLVAHDNKGALAAAQDASAVAPNALEVLDALGRAQAAAGETQQATTTFRKMAALDVRSPAPHLRLAGVYHGLGNREAAMDALNRALGLAPDSVEIPRSMITMALEMKQPQQALALAKALQKRQPGNPIGQVFEGDIAEYQRDWPAAVTAYRVALAKSPDANKVAVKLHRVLLASGQVGQADEFASTWARTHPKDVPFMMYMGDRALQAKQYATAEPYFRAAVAQSPDNAAGLNNLAWLMVMQGRKGAAALAEKAVALAPDAPTMQDTLALALAAEGELPKALAVAKRGVTAAPDQPALRLTLAKLLLQSGDRTAARVELDTLAKLGSRFSDQAAVADLLKSAQN